jgi:hypothetical protein
MGLTDDDLKALAEAYACALASDRPGTRQAADRLGPDAVEQLLVAVSRLKSECRRRLGTGNTAAAARGQDGSLPAGGRPDGKFYGMGKEPGERNQGTRRSRNRVAPDVRRAGGLPQRPPAA